MTTTPETISVNDEIKTLYAADTTYMDLYGGSVVLFVLVLCILFLLISYFVMLTNIQPIQSDWAAQRCKPGVMPFAGMIHANTGTLPPGTTSGEFTQQNFNYCTQQILTSVTSTALAPLTQGISQMSSMATNMSGELQGVRGMFDKMRTMFQTVATEVMGRLMNVVVSLTQMIVGMRDMLAKTQGTMTAAVFTLFGGYLTLKSLMGAIAQFILIILIALSAVIASLWAVPVTWGAAVANTAIFVAIAVPFSIILAFMSKVMHIDVGGMTIPKVKCFDEMTPIQMDNASYKPIHLIRVGERLADNNRVTATICVATDGSDMYNLDNVVVSDSHRIFSSATDPDNVHVYAHSRAIKLSNYNKPYLYCLNTEHKHIAIQSRVFSDWDDITDDELMAFNINKTEVHSHYDGGFAPNTLIELANGDRIHISEVQIHDVLKHGEVVYGIVQIDGLSVDQYEWIDETQWLPLSNRPNKKEIHQSIQTGPNMVFITPAMRKRRVQHNNHKYPLLNHLLTDCGTFSIGIGENSALVFDYNASIDSVINGL